MAETMQPGPRELSDLPEADQLAIIDTMSRLQTGFRERDADESGVHVVGHVPHLDVGHACISHATPQHGRSDHPAARRDAATR
jgi:hypothetical protein